MLVSLLFLYLFLNYYLNNPEYFEQVFDYLYYKILALHNIYYYLNNLNETTDSITIKYLYYEYYEKENDNPNYNKKELLNTLKQEWNNKLDRLYQLVLLLNKVH